jgi:hypothetical protein
MQLMGFACAGLLLRFDLALKSLREVGFHMCVDWLGHSVFILKISITTAPPADNRLDERKRGDDGKYPRDNGRP